MPASRSVHPPSLYSARPIRVGIVFALYFSPLYSCFLLTWLGNMSGPPPSPFLPPPPKGSLIPCLSASACHGRRRCDLSSCLRGAALWSLWSAPTPSPPCLPLPPPFHPHPCRLPLSGDFIVSFAAPCVHRALSLAHSVHSCLPLPSPCPGFWLARGSLRSFLRFFLSSSDVCRCLRLCVLRSYVPACIRVQHLFSRRPACRAGPLFAASNLPFSPSLGSAHASVHRFRHATLFACLFCRAPVSLARSDPLPAFHRLSHVPCMPAHERCTPHELPACVHAHGVPPASPERCIPAPVSPSAPPLLVRCLWAPFAALPALCARVRQSP